MMEPAARPAIVLLEPVRCGPTSGNVVVLAAHPMWDCGIVAVFAPTSFRLTWSAWASMRR
jgi:hypothetical protein